MGHFLKSRIRTMSNGEFYFWGTFERQFIWIIPLFLFSFIVNGGIILILGLGVFSVLGIYMKCAVEVYAEEEKRSGRRRMINMFGSSNAQGSVLW